MSAQLLISLITLGMTVAGAIGVYSWRGGAWTGGERRHTEDLERRMDVANGELSKLTSTVQTLMLLGKDVAVLQAQHQASDREMSRIDHRLTSLERQR